MTDPEHKPTVIAGFHLRDVIAIGTLFVGGLIGYAKLQSDVSSIKSTYISKDQMAIGAATGAGDQALQNDRIVNLALRISELTLEIEAQRRQIELMHDELLIQGKSKK